MAKNSARSHRKNNRFSQIPNSPIQRSVLIVLMITRPQWTLDI